MLEQDGQGNQTAWNVYGTNLIMRKVGADTLTYMYNGHADVTALLDSSGNLVATYYYDAFGNILEKTGTAENSILYGGYQYDEETGLYYLNARMYDPVTARFLQQDSHKGQYNDPLSLNLYTYCHNEPLMYSDPTGHRELVGASFERETEKERKQSLATMAQRSKKTTTKGSPTSPSKPQTSPSKPSSSSPSSTTSSSNGVVLKNSTLGDIINAGIWGGHYDPNAEGYYKAQQMYLVWFWNTDAAERLGDGNQLPNSGYLILDMYSKQKQGVDLSNLTVEQVDSWYNEVNRLAFSITSVAVIAYGAYATYTYEKYAVNTAGTVAEGVGNKLTTNEAQLKHMFRDAEGHFLQDNPANRAVIEKAAGSSNNFLGMDKYGNSWYAETLPNGTQAWAEIRNGVITEGGLNQVPKVFDPHTGLKANIVP